MGKGNIGGGEGTVILTCVLKGPDLQSCSQQGNREESSENFLMSFRGWGGGGWGALGTFEKPEAILSFPSQGTPPLGSIALGNSAGPLGLTASRER